MKPFFFIGNRRSGTTLLCHLINLHPQMYVPFERYIMWILYQIWLNGEADGFRAHPRAVAIPMWKTLGWAGRVFAGVPSEALSIEVYRQAFFDAAEACMRVRRDGRQHSPIWIGEKNPPEYADPPINEFIRMVHPEARFIHMVRHPKACVQSKLDFAERHTFARGIWQHPEPLMYMRWAQHERWALDVEAPTLWIKYEDLCADPVAVMQRLFAFFEVDVPGDQMTMRIREVVGACANSKYSLDVLRYNTSNLHGLMKCYGY